MSFLGGLLCIFACVGRRHVTFATREREEEEDVDNGGDQVVVNETSSKASTGTIIKIQNNLVLKGGASSGRGLFQDLLIDAVTIDFLQNEILVPVGVAVKEKGINFDDSGDAAQLLDLWNLVAPSYKRFQEAVNAKCGPTAKSPECLTFVTTLEKKKVPKAALTRTAYVAIMMWVQRMFLRHMSYEGVTAFMKNDPYCVKSRESKQYMVPLAIWISRGVGDCRLHGIVGAILLQQLESMGLVQDSKAVYGRRYGDADGDDHMFNLYTVGEQTYSYDGYFYPYNAYKIEAIRSHPSLVNGVSFNVPNFSFGGQFVDQTAVATFILKTLIPDLQPKASMYNMVLEMQKLTQNTTFIPKDSEDFVSKHAHTSFKDEYSNFSDEARTIAVIPWPETEPFALP